MVARIIKEANQKNIFQWMDFAFTKNISEC